MTDRGLHNRGVFARALGTMGTDVRTIGPESPEQLGRTEGGMWKATAKRVTQSFKIVGSEDMTLMALNNNGIMNESTRKGGFAPVQWVLGRFPRNPGSIPDGGEFAKLGVLSDQVSPDVAFARLTKLRQACRGAFAAEDCSVRVKRALLRKAAPQARY